MLVVQSMMMTTVTLVVMEVVLGLVDAVTQETILNVFVMVAGKYVLNSESGVLNRGHQTGNGGLHCLC